MSEADPRQRSRTIRARLLVVGGGSQLAELATVARRSVAHVSEVSELYDALDECNKATAREPIAAVILSPDCDGYDARAVADAFARIDPALPLILAVTAEQEELTAESTREGFEDSLLLPVRENDLAELLADLGIADRKPPRKESERETPPTTLPPQLNVMELQVERAQERVHQQPPDVQPTVPPVAPQAGGAAGAKQPAPPRKDLERKDFERKDLERKDLERKESDRKELDPAPREQSRAPRPAFQMPISGTTQPAHAADAPPSDLDLVRAVTAGHDVHNAALRVLRHHLGSTDVRFVAEARPGEEDAVEIDRRGLRQVHVRNDAGHSYGVLLSRSIDETKLQAWATWLAHWLALDEQHHELRRLAWTDELTGAGNRRAFEKLLADTIKSARAERRELSLMFFDIDDFKQYNDMHGHETGDEVLREIVELVRCCIRRGDHVFRIGGDEFVVLFCDPAGPRAGGTLLPESVESIARRFQSAVCKLSLPQLGLDGPGTVSISAGIAAFPWDGDDAARLLRHADRLAMESKRAGKNVITFGPGMRRSEDQP